MRIVAIRERDLETFYVRFNVRIILNLRKVIELWFLASA